MLKRLFYKSAEEAIKNNAKIYPRHRKLQLQFQEVVADPREENRELHGSCLCACLISTVLLSRHRSKIGHVPIHVFRYFNCRPSLETIDLGF